MNAREDLSILKSFHVSSPWADRRSLIASWKWRDGVNLKYFEKAYLYYYSSLDEGFEKTKPISKPINSFTISNLRPETVYFICLRVLRRRRFPGITETSHNQNKFESTNLNGSEINVLGRKVRQIVQPWQQRYPPTMKTADNYEFEVKCCEATTQNWHLSALIGGLLGVAIAIILGLLLLFAIKRKKIWLTSKSPTHTNLLSGNCICNYSRKSQLKHRGDNSRRTVTTRSNFGRGRNALGRNMKDGLDEEEDEEEDAIAEDDEDTEADTGCKSSVRSQTGIYGGSGNTTSSYRPSSVSSIDPREDSYSLTHHLPINNQQTIKRVSRVTKPEMRDVKQSKEDDHNYKERHDDLNIDPRTSVIEAPCFGEFKVKIVSPSPDLIDTKEDLHSLGVKTPGDGQTTSDSSENEQIAYSRDSLRRLIKNSSILYERNLAVNTELITISAAKDVYSKVNCGKMADSFECNLYDTITNVALPSTDKMLNNIIPSICFELGYLQTCHELLGEHSDDRSPIPLSVPQPVNLQPPVVFSPNETLIGTFSTNSISSLIESPKLNEPLVARAYDNDSSQLSVDYSSTSFPVSSTLSVSSTDSDNFDTTIEVDEIDFVEFVETI